jgi:predicted ATP-grasp superfamily ATP-dependent carboligase
MNLLIFEYITGGGFNKQTLPAELAREGRLMLQAVLADFAALGAVKLTVMLDQRLADSFDTAHLNIAVISPEHHAEHEFARLIGSADAVWVIAPECENILCHLCQQVEKQGKRLLTSPASAVAITGDKFKTYQRLSQHAITTVPTQLAERAQFTAGEWLIKPRDGVGGMETRILPDRETFEHHVTRSPHFIIQPHLQGEKISLCCLCKGGRSWLLSVNLQRFNMVDQHYQLAEIVVNHQPITPEYQQVAANIARALPDLWGYVGIDLIVTDTQILVLEINPRLTTSFAGLRAALGVNVADLVLQLINGEPIIAPAHSLPITIKVTKHANHTRT